MKVSKEPKYLSYLLRMWQEQPDAPWRATLQNPHTGDQRHFATLAHLFNFLESQAAERPSPDNSATDPG